MSTEIVPARPHSPEPEPRLPWWERALLAVAPRWALSRAQARHLARSFGAYEAAAGGRSSGGWWRSGSDANAANGPALGRLRELARDLRRNNGWARRAVEVIANNTVGWGIAASAVYDDLEPLPGEDLRARLERRRQARERQPHVERAQRIWNAWADSTACDYDGRLTLAGLTRLAMETIVESGEVVILRHTVERDDGLLPLKLQVLEPDHIDTAKDGLPALDASGQATGWITQGIEFDSRGQRVAYWLFERHPGSHRLPAKSYVSKRVPADRVIHCYRVDRPGQVRGVSWFAPSIAPLQEGADLDLAAIVGLKTAACFAGIVTTPEGMPVRFGEQHALDPVRERIEPGTVAHLQPGQTITFATPPANPQYEPVMKRNLFRLSASFGITYEDQTNDYEKVNFSSARLARLSHWGNVWHWQWNLIVPQVCDPIWAWAMDLAIQTGLLDQRPRVEWTPPTMPMIEPDKEGLAYQRLLRNGGMSGEEMARERGKDPRRLLDEIARWQEQLDERDIILDSDPRHTNQSGALQGQAAPKPAAAPPPIPTDA